MKKCKKCNKTKSIECHHITYEPELTENLCSVCHQTVTMINTLVAQIHNNMKPVSNEQRIDLHRFFLDTPLWILYSIVPTSTPKKERFKRKTKSRSKNKPKVWGGSFKEQRKWSNWYKPENA